MDKKKICILTSGHPPFDERIFWKFGITLVEKKFDVLIVSSTENLNTEKLGITFNCFEGKNISSKQKIDRFYDLIGNYKPDTVVCCEPMTIIPAFRYKKYCNKHLKIILDVTEFYPHQNTLRLYSGLKRILKHLQLSLFNIYASNLTDGITAGERGKMKLYKLIAPRSKKSIISYFAPKRYFNFKEIQLENEIVFCFLGEQSEDRGFPEFLEVILLLVNSINVSVKIIFIGSNHDNQVSSNNTPNTFAGTEKISVVRLPRIDYNELGQVLSESHFLMDLRAKTNIFDRSLPIRIFDYLACGRPVLFSNLRALLEFDDLTPFVHLVDPSDTNQAVRIIIDYFNHPDLFEQHCKAARTAFEEKYNWEKIEPDLIEVINH